MIEHTYLRVRWLHASPDDPIELWSELDEDRYEIRKIEIWLDGRVGFASADQHHGETGLGEAPVPPFHEIAADPEFLPKIISQAEFERYWESHVR